MDPRTANHICNVIRRQVLDSFDHLTLAFIAHENGKRKQAVALHEESLLSHPAGEKMLHFILNHEDGELAGNNSHFLGLASEQISAFLGFSKKQEFLSVLFINCTRFDDQDDLRNHAIHMAWHALALLEDMDSKSENARYEIKEGVVVPRLNPEEFCHRNLLADIFSGSLQELMGRKGAIRALARQRMKDTLGARTGFVAEQYPYPVTLETLEFLFTDILKNLSKKQKDLPQAIQITKEIGQTYGLPSIRQWHEFSQPAQEMAWCGFDPATILGAAIYTNENTYVRSAADMVAEHMEIKPVLVSTLEDYNPFTEQEVNVRVHHRKCLDEFKSLFTYIHMPQAAEILRSTAARQNKKLALGNPTGWCACALIAAAGVIEANIDEETNSLKKRAADTFETVLYETSWVHICDYGRHILHHRRQGREIVLEKMKRLADKRPEYGVIKGALERVGIG